MLVTYEDDLVAETSYENKAKGGQPIDLRLTMSDLKASFAPINVCVGQGSSYIDLGNAASSHEYLYGGVGGNSSTACVTTIECEPMSPCGHCQRCVATTVCNTTTTTPFTLHRDANLSSSSGACGIASSSNVCAQPTLELSDLYLDGGERVNLTHAQYKYLLEQWVLQEFDSYGNSDVRVYKKAFDAMVKIVDSFTQAVTTRLSNKIKAEKIVPTDVDLETFTGQILGINPSTMSGTSNLPIEDSFYTTGLSRQMIAAVIRSDFLQHIELKQSKVVDRCDPSATVQSVVNVVEVSAVNQAARDFQERVLCRRPQKP